MEQSNPNPHARKAVKEQSTSTEYGTTGGADSYDVLKVFSSEHRNPNSHSSKTEERKPSSAECGATGGGADNYEVQSKLPGDITCRPVSNPTINVTGNLYMSSGDQLHIGNDQINYGVPQSHQRCTSAPEVETGEFNLKECQEQLINFYHGAEMKVQLLPWDPNHTAEMETIFVNLALVKEEVLPAVTNEIPLNRNEDLVTLQNRVIITGDGGSGKTTLVDNIAYTWALQNKESPLSKFQLVFIIRAHEIFDKNASLVDIIFDQILEEDKNVSKSGLASYMKLNAKKVLFLVDGLDEDNLGILQSNSAEITKVLYNKKLKNSCVIVTTRPYKLSEMGRHQGLYTKVNLKGFSDENIELYINKYFASYPNRGAELITVLTTRPYLWVLAATPILLLFLCLLWNGPNPTNRRLPDTKTKLYQEAVKCIWKRYHYEKIGLSDEELDSEELKIKLEEFLRSLGQVAIGGIADQPDDLEKTAFNNSDFEEEVLNLALKVGIMSRQGLRSKTNTTTIVIFLHKSLQDFCAAVYLANLELVDHLQFEKYVEKLLPTPAILLRTRVPISLRKHGVIEFCSGTRNETIKLIAEKMINIYLPILYQKSFDQHYQENITKFLDICLILNLVFEGQLTYTECTDLVAFYSDRKVPLSLTFTPASAVHFQYQLDLLKQMNMINGQNNGLFFSVITKIQIDWPIELPQWLRLIRAILEYTTNLTHFYSMFQLSPSVQSLNLEHLFKMLSKSKHLEDLSLVRQNSNGESVVDISNALPSLGSNKSLDVFYLKDINFTVSAMTKFLSLNSSLTVLILDQSFCQSVVRGKQDIRSMMRILSTLKHLSHISLINFKIGSAVKCLKSNIPQLKSLRLENAGLGVWDLHELALLLQEAKKLIILRLSANILDTALYNLANRLKHMINLKELGLVRTDLDDANLIALIEGIKEGPLLCRLDLRGNPHIGLEGRKAIRSLKQLSRFQELEVNLDLKMICVYNMHEQKFENFIIEGYEIPPQLENL